MLSLIQLSLAEFRPNQAVVVKTLVPTIHFEHGQCVYAVAVQAAMVSEENATNRKQFSVKRHLTSCCGDQSHNPAIRLTRQLFWWLKQFCAARRHQQGEKPPEKASLEQVRSQVLETGRDPGGPNNDTLPVQSYHSAKQPCADRHLIWSECDLPTLCVPRV